MRHLCIGIAIFLPVAVSFLNSLSVIWLSRRVNRDLYPPVVKVNRAETEQTLTDFQKGIKDFAKW